MISLGLLSQIYLVSMIVGGGFIAVNLFMGNIADSADDGGGGGGDDFAGGGDDGGGGGGDSADGGGDDFGGANNGLKLLTPGIARANIVGAHHPHSMSMHSTPVIPRLSARIGSFLLGLL